MKFCTGDEDDNSSVLEKLYLVVDGVALLVGQTVADVRGVGVFVDFIMSIRLIAWNTF